MVTNGVNFRVVFSRLLCALAFATPLGFAWIVHSYVAEPLRDARSLHVQLSPVHAHSAAELAERMVAHSFTWPPSAYVPRLELAALPPDLGDLSVTERKALFFRIVLPLALAENARLERLRGEIEATFARGTLHRGSHAYRFAHRAAHQYRVDGDLNDPDVRALLLRRVDAVPLALVLAQAADESAWGTSRFAVEGNALFGQWTWMADAGLKPLRRAPGARHHVHAFPGLRDSVRAYLHNLNVGHAYVALRASRERMRAEGRMLDAVELAESLQRYSERGKRYVADVRNMIRDNDLEAIESVTLAPLAGALLLE